MGRVPLPELRRAAAVLPVPSCLIETTTKGRDACGDIPDTEAPTALKCPFCDADKNKITLAGHLVREHKLTWVEAAEEMRKLK